MTVHAPALPELDSGRRRLGDPDNRAPGIVAALALIVGLVASPFSGVDPIAAEGVFGRLVDGAAEILDGGEWRQLSNGEIILADQQVRVARTGATFATVEASIAPTPGAALVTQDGGLTIETGSVLVQAAALFRVDAGFVESSGTGAFRVDFGGAPRVGVYRGSAGVRLDDPAAETPSASVGSFEQVSLLDGAPSGDIEPLRYSPVDPWDQSLLAAAIAIDAQVGNICRSLQSTYGGEPRGPDFYDDFVVIDGPLLDALDRYGPACPQGTSGAPADVLVNTLAARLLVDQAGLPAQEAVDEVIALRADGAGWGLILLRRDLGLDDVLAAVDDALRRRAVEAPGAPIPPGLVAPTPTPSPTGSTPSPTPSPTSSPTAPPRPSPEPPGPSDEPLLPEPPVPLPDPVDEAIEDVVGQTGLDDLLGPVVDDLPGLPPAPGP